MTQYLLSQNYDKAERLTDKEYEVLKCLSLGFSNKAIAETLNNSEGAIRNHVSQIIAKLNVKDRTQAVIKAINDHLL